MGILIKNALAMRLSQKLINFEVDLLFVAFGVPSQELWIESYKNDLNAKVVSV